jgi:hypothetical protein
MADFVDSFENIIAIVRTCVQANRADLIEPSLIDRLHNGEVRAKIESERTARPAARPAAAASSIFGDGPTAEQRDALAAATKRRYEAETKRS